MLRRELRGAAAPHLQHADDIALRHQRNRQRRLDPLGAREVEEVAADDVAQHVVLDGAGFARRKHPARHALTRAHSQRRCLRREIADTALHRQPIVLHQHDAADIGAEAGLGFVGDLREDVVEIGACEDARRDPLENVNGLQLVRVAVPRLASAQRQMQDLTETAQQAAGRIGRVAQVQDQRDGRRRDAGGRQRALARIGQPRPQFVEQGGGGLVETLFAVEAAAVAPGASGMNDDPDVLRVERVSDDDARFGEQRLLPLFRGAGQQCEGIKENGAFATPPRGRRNRG